MRIRNNEIKQFCEFLLGLEMTAKATRMRSRFIKMCNERLVELEESRLDMLNKYGKKTNDGKLDIDEHGNVQLAYPDMFLKDYNEMMADDFIIDELSERQDMLSSIKDSVLNISDNITFSGQKAVDYDRWCDIVEGIS
jgi:hypothetical protein